MLLDLWSSNLVGHILPHIWAIERHIFSWSRRVIKCVSFAYAHLQREPLDPSWPYRSPCVCVHFLTSSNMFTAITLIAHQLHCSLIVIRWADTKLPKIVEYSVPMVRFEPCFEVWHKSNWEANTLIILSSYKTCHICTCTSLVGTPKPELAVSKSLLVFTFSHQQ